ncbi:MAG: tRNA-dihydrouridine synthase family protein [Campylobacteraceae bacterium]|jgi:tRNA-dihydrouridine synthase B|nr:tRNA-dihydrouridine synthase family protein [Campylobacteraceae bacterium]
MLDIDFSQSPAALAPLAGLTDLPFRYICKKFGADITFSEMISVNALIRDSKKTFHMLKCAPNEDRYIIQLAGSDIAGIVQAVEILNDIDGIIGIDLNCGCPVPKVTAQDAGSSLLRDLPHLLKIVEAIKKHSNKRYTSVKTRIGFSEKTPEIIAKTIEDAGADFISIHGRTRNGGYKALVDYDAIRRAKEAVKIPVFANGDITTYEKALEVKGLTKCEGVMIGRGAVGNPWIFYQLKHNQKSVDKSLIKSVVLEHLQFMREFYKDEMGVILFRKHLHAYSKSLPEAAAFRNRVNAISNADEMRLEIENFFGA